MYSRICKLIPFLCLNVFVILSNDNALCDVIYENILNDNYYGFNSNYGSQQIADEFEITQEITITGLEFYGGYYDGGEYSTETYDIFLYGDNAGFPGESVLEEHNITPIEIVNTGLYRPYRADTFYKYTVNFMNPYDLSAGRYFLLVRSDNAVKWAWSNSEPDDDELLYVSYNNMHEWIEGQMSVAQRDMAFTLYGTPVPIPSAIWFLGVGLIGLVSFRRKVNVYRFKSLTWKVGRSFKIQLSSYLFQGDGTLVPKQFKFSWISHLKRVIQVFN